MSKTKWMKEIKMTEQRKDEIRDFLDNNWNVTMKQMCSMFGVSMSELKKILMK